MDVAAFSELVEQHDRLVLVGVADGLRDQTERTTDWSVDSRDLRVTERGGHAWFGDRVSLAWTDTERRIRYEFDTRWTGTLELDEAVERSEGGERDDTADDTTGDRWQFVAMHVSTARGL